MQTVTIKKQENDPRTHVKGSYRMALLDDDMTIVKEYAWSKAKETTVDVLGYTNDVSECKAMLDAAMEMLIAAKCEWNPKGTMSWGKAVQVARAKLDMENFAALSIGAVISTIVFEAGQLRSKEYAIRNNGKKMTSKYAGRDCITGKKINVGDEIVYSSNGTVLA